MRADGCCWLRLNNKQQLAWCGGWSAASCGRALRPPHRWAKSIGRIRLDALGGGARVRIAHRPAAAARARVSSHARTAGHKWHAKRVLRARAAE